MTSSAAIWDKLENLPRPTLGELFSAVRDGGEGADEPGGAERVAIPLAGIAIGDGWVDPIRQMAGYPELMFAFGLADVEQRRRLNEQ